MFPSQTFPNLEAVRTYVNTFIIPNGANLIDGTEANNVLNSLITFIEQAPLNWAGVTLITGGGNIVAGSLGTPGPVLLFTGITPTSLGWSSPTPYNEYVFINVTPNPIPLATDFTYLDLTLTPRNSVPANQALVIYMLPNNQWVQGNNLSSTGNVPGGGIPGQYLGTNGTIPIWQPTHIKIQVSSFTSPTVYNNGLLAGMYYDIFCNDISRYFSTPNEDPNPEWTNNSGGGFTITIPEFNLQTLSYPLYLYFKPNPA